LKQIQKKAEKIGMLWIFKKAGEKNKRNENYQFWQQENHPIECSAYEILQSKNEVFTRKSCKSWFCKK
jgi:hypothetical protein